MPTFGVTIQLEVEADDEDDARAKALDAIADVGPELGERANVEVKRLT